MKRNKSKTDKNQSQIAPQNDVTTPNKNKSTHTFIPDELASTIAQKLTVTHSGPLPLPEILDGYKKIDPSFPERIVLMAEKHST